MESCKAEKILITGGAGFIGSHLVDRLLEEKEEVIVVDNFDDFYNPQIKRDNLKNHLSNPHLKLLEMDIRDKKALEQIFELNEITQVVHLAARAGVRASIKNPVVYEEVNVKGTLNLLEVCKNKNLKNFIFASSSSVYGVNTKLPFSENDSLSYPISPYAVTKKTGELICYTYHHLYGIPIICLRLFTVYGPRQRPEMAIYKFTRLIDQNCKIPIFGDGHSKRDYTFISDVIEGIMSTLKQKFDFQIFNLGSSKPVELKNLVSLIESALGKKAKINRTLEQPGDVPITYADITKAKKLLGYNPKVGIEEGIKKFVKWHKNRFSQ
ncbi:MAG: GDP-mannose 4,6-dehydratase [Candidatus Aerophobetes bacterium]|nr:GDP-mannose 4,6-dehydratase [Candidatus Aerophobetes bacterium]